jgi:hypothetical protein
MISCKSHSIPFLRRRRDFLKERALATPQEAKNITSLRQTSQVISSSYLPVSPYRARSTGRALFYSSQQAFLFCSYTMGSSPHFNALTTKIRSFIGEKVYLLLPTSHLTVT